MQKVKTFIHVLINSFIPQATYYPKILHAKFAFSLQYYIVLLLAFNFIFIASLPFKYNFSGLPDRINAVTDSLKQFPADLRVTINNGFLVTNYNRPYFMWLKDNNRETLLLAIDESHSLQSSDLKPLILFTNQSLIFNTGDHPTTLPLANLKTQMVNKQRIDILVNSFTTLQRLFPLFILSLFLILLIVIPIGSFIINTIYILIASLIVGGIFRLFLKQKFNFKKTLQISFHAVTLPLVIDYFLVIVNPASKFSLLMPLLFLILLSVFIFGGIYEAHLIHLKSRK